jgi:glutamine amidotransferase
MSQLAVIDYGMGNLHSVASAVQHVAPDVDVIVTSDAERVRKADRVIFPGVGAIRDCVAEIRRLGIDALIEAEMASGKPVLAICVGMQALMNESAENGGVPCLKHFDGSVAFFSEDPDFVRANAEHTLKVPHMGWNQVTQKQEHPVWEAIEDNARFYFVHSYFVKLEDKELEFGASHFGLPFTSVIAKDNVFATQFHPEKSHNAGLQLLRNFVSWNGKV